MADIEALKFKHRLFKDGQMLVSKKELRAYWDESCPDKEPEPDGDHTHLGVNIPSETPMIVISEGTSRSAYDQNLTMRSIVVLFTNEHGHPKQRKIMLNPLYGHKEIGYLFTLDREELDQKS